MFIEAMKKKKTLKIAKPSQPTDLEYIKLFDDCIIDATKIGTLDKTIDDQISANKSRYQDISSTVSGNSFLKPATNFYSFNSLLTQATPTLKLPQSSFFDGLRANPFQIKNPFDTMFTNFSVGANQIPWYFIACAHYLECSFDFKRHLHNGDPLSGYTVRVPANRPKVGHGPPFTFEESAVDALKLMKLNEISNWNLPTVLRKLEAYNGFGYYKYHSINSPYLWSFSNQYSKGKYVADGKFDAKAVSQQMGAAVILKRMEQRALIYIPRH
jgi:lysozyme family protein